MSIISKRNTDKTLRDIRMVQKFNGRGRRIDNRGRLQDYVNAKRSFNPQHRYAYDYTEGEENDL